jgi:hypothetical protein
MKSYFIFSTRDGYYIVESKDVDKIPKPRELVRRANAVEVLREYAEKEGIVFAVDKARKRSKHTQKTKDKISAIMKANHPHKDGISEKHRQSIIKHHTGKYRGEDNNMYGRKQKMTSKLKISAKRRARGKYKHVCNPNGYTSIPENQPLPEGYQLGRIYDPYRPTD